MLLVAISACKETAETSPESAQQAPDAEAAAAQQAPKATESKVSALEMTVFKSPTCGCCGAWVSHLEDNGFTVKTIDTSQTQKVKDDLTVPGELRSCHTGVIGGYVVEGHVPAEAVLKLMQDKPAISGLAVPGMPLGSPGMEHPEPENYEVIAYQADGTQTVYARFGPDHSGHEESAH